MCLIMSCLSFALVLFLFLLVFMFCFFFFFFNDTATTEIYPYLHTLSLHDALPISAPISTPASAITRSGSTTSFARRTPSPARSCSTSPAPTISSTRRPRRKCTRGWTITPKSRCTTIRARITASRPRWASAGARARRGWRTGAPRNFSRGISHERTLSADNPRNGWTGGHHARAHPRADAGPRRDPDPARGGWPQLYRHLSALRPLRAPASVRPRQRRGRRRRGRGRRRRRFQGRRPGGLLLRPGRRLCDPPHRRRRTRGRDTRPHQQRDRRRHHAERLHGGVSHRALRPREAGRHRARSRRSRRSGVDPGSLAEGDRRDGHRPCRKREESGEGRRIRRRSRLEWLNRWVGGAGPDADGRRGRGGRIRRRRGIGRASGRERVCRYG